MDQVSREERDLFRQAVTEAFIRKFDRELADCPFSADCSEAHVSRMEAIMDAGIGAARRKKRKSWVVALLVAGDDMAKVAIGFVHLFREKWVKNVTQQIQEG